MKKQSKHKGMTLIELIIVIAIIAILVAISVPAFGQIIQNGKDTALKTTAQRILDAMNNYVLINDEEIRKNGGYSVQAVVERKGADYEWKVYTKAGGETDPCYMPNFPFQSTCTLVYDSTKSESDNKMESFENYIDSLIDPQTGEKFGYFYVHYDKDYTNTRVNEETNEVERYNESVGNISLHLEGKGYTLIMNTFDVFYKLPYNCYASYE